MSADVVDVVLQLLPPRAHAAEVSPGAAAKLSPDRYPPPAPYLFLLLSLPPNPSSPLGPRSTIALLTTDRRLLLYPLRAPQRAKWFDCGDDQERFLQYCLPFSCARLFLIPCVF